MIAAFNCIPIKWHSTKTNSYACVLDPIRHSALSGVPFSEEYMSSRQLWPLGEQLAYDKVPDKSVLSKGLPDNCQRHKLQSHSAFAVLL